MFLQKLTKSYSSSLPTYEPIPPYSPSSPPSPTIPDHETGSFSCTYSPQHSLGVARINLQSAQINEPEGWRGWFKRRPSTWVKVKVLGRTNMEKGKGRGRGKNVEGEVKTWREERVVGRTDVCEKTYTPNFSFKSYHALIGPYEHQLELEVHSKRTFSWLFPKSGRSKVVGTASFLFPPSVHAHTAVTNHPKHGEGEAEWYEDAIEQERDGQEHEHNFHERDHSPVPAALTPGSHASLTSSRSHSRSRTVHEEPEELTEWPVQAALLNPDLSGVEGYLFFNVFWYPAIPAQVPIPAFRSREDDGADENGYEDRHEGGGGGGGELVEVNPIPYGRPQPGIVTFTLHAIHAVDVGADAHMEVSVSLGWKSKPLHTCRALKAEHHSRASSPSTSYRGEKNRPKRRASRHDNGYGNQRDYGATSNEDEKEQVGEGTVTRFDSPFEFLCMDPTTTNVVVKVFEVRHHRGLLPTTERMMVGHTSVSLLDLMQGQDSPLREVDPNASLDLNAQLAARREGERRGRDRMLSLLEHPTGKVKVCVEWRALRVPEVSHEKHVHE